MTRAATGTTRTVKKAAPPPPEPEELDELDDEDEAEGTDADGRAWARLVFNDRPVRMYEPTDGQRFVLVQTIGIGDESADDQEKLELALGFAAMIRALFVRPADRQFVTGALARGTAEIDDYFGLARDMAERWGIESEAPANNRQERRARERRPVAKAAVRPRR
jgi:hypothetical protein